MTPHKSEDYKLSAVEYYLTEKYENIFKGTYNRIEKYVKKPSNRTRKLKNYLP